MLEVIRSIIFIVAFALLVNPVWAGDEISIKDLGKALAALGPDVDPGEAELLSLTAHTTARSLAREYRMVLNPEFQNFLINIGARQRGYCAHWARDIGTRLKELKPRTLVLHWGASYAGTSGEHNVVVVTARNQPFGDGIIIDGWRRAGRLYWCTVRKDALDKYDKYIWKEDMGETAWLQDYGPSERKPTKRAAQRGH
jgi:hypothetical protein